MTTKEEAASNVLFVLNGKGMEPGSFTTSLIHTIVKADNWNRAALSSVYPELVEAVNIYLNVNGGIEALEERAARLYS